MVKNTQLAYATLDYIRDHPQEWDQDQYYCDTTACFAGRALLIHLGLTTPAKYRDSRQWIDVGQAAREALGWTRAESIRVFHNYTTDFAVLEEAVKEVLNGEIGS